MSSAKFIIPGHQDPIGSWPTVQLENARAEFIADRDAGYLPPKVDFAIAAIDDELMRRGLGGAREPAEPTGFGRALERWFPEEATGLPLVRGMESASHAPELATEPVRQLETARAPMLEQGLDEANAAHGGRKEVAALELIWSRPEPEEKQERAREAEIEP